MAVSVSGVAASKYSRTTGLPTVTNFTICGWSYVIANQVGYLVSVNNLVPAADAIAGVVLNGASTFEVWSGTGAGTTFNTNAAASGPAQGVWFFWYIQCSGSGAGLLKAGWAPVGGTSFITCAVTLAGTPTPSDITLGVEIYSDPTNARFAGVKSWDAVLTTAELQQEMMSLRPQKWASLSSWYPMFDATLANNVKDYSGNGRDLTAGSSVALADPPPVSYGASVLTYLAAGGPAIYTLTAAAGAFTLTGVAATLRFIHMLVAAKGAFTLTGVAASLKRAYTIAAAKGAFTLTGVAATLRAMRALVAAKGTFTTTGVAAGLKRVLKIVAVKGAFLISGVAAALRYSNTTVTLTAAKGAFVLTGQAALLIRRRVLSALTGAFTLTGATAAVQTATPYPWHPPSFFIPPFGYGACGLGWLPVWEDELTAETTWSAIDATATDWTAIAETPTTWRS